MNNKKLFGLLSMIYSAVALPAFAAPITFTGAELATLPNSSFPTAGQTILGDDLRFDPTINQAILYQLDLSDFIVDPSEISVSVNFTRLLGDLGLINQAFRIGLYDGQNYFHSVFFDLSSSNALQARHRIDLLSSDGRSRLPNISLETGPSISAPVDSLVQLDFTIRATPTLTEISGAINQSADFSSQTPLLLNTNNNLSLLLAGTNNGENYLINSLTFTNGLNIPVEVPEPGHLLGLSFVLMALSLYLHRRQKPKV